MEISQNHHMSFILLIFSGALVSFALCLAAEFKKSNKDDLRFDGKLCYLPGSSAFGLGIAALICLSITQIIGTLFSCTRISHSRRHTCYKSRKPFVSCMLFSWISFGFAVVLIGGATSLSRAQPFGEGWLDGECYLLKDGVYVGSAFLGLLALASALGLGAEAKLKKTAGRFMHKLMN